MPEFGDEALDQPIPQPSRDDLIDGLRGQARAPGAIVPSVIVYGLSDLTAAALQEIAPAWQELSPIAKHRVLRALNEASEAMFELNFREIALLALDDESSLARSSAIELLWIDESADTMLKLMRLADADPDPGVRARALEQLGRFILLGEYGDIAVDLAARAQALTYRLHGDAAQPIEVRRRALEALANSSHPRVNELIRGAYANGNHELQVGAIFAMGRTCNEIWRGELLAELENSEGERVYEAIKACGQIGIKEAVERIIEFTLSDDQDLQMIAIWALGEIGGKRAFEVLSRLEAKAADDEMAAAIDEALDAAGFSLSFASLGLDVIDG